MKEWHIGKILEVDEDEKDCLVSFMRRDACQGSNKPTFKWPSPVDEIWVEFRSVLMRITEPSKQGRSGRKSVIAEDETKSIEEKMKFACI